MDDFSFDVEGNIGDEAEARVQDFETTLRQFNSKQWYENLDGSDVAHQIFHNTSSHGNF